MAEEVNKYEALRQKLMQEEIDKAIPSEENDQKRVMTSAIPMLAGVLLGNASRGAQMTQQMLTGYEAEKNKNKANLLSYLSKMKPAKSDPGRIITKDIIVDGMPKTMAYNENDLLSRNVNPLDLGMAQAKGAPIMTEQQGLVSPAKVQVTPGLTKESTGKTFRDSVLYTDANGNPVIAKFDKKGNVESTETKQVGKQESFKMSDNTSWTPTQNQQKLIEATEAKYLPAKMKNEALKNDLDKAYSTMGTGQFGDKAGVMGLAKQLEGGRMTDQDRDYYSNEISMGRRLIALLEQQTSNQLNPRLVEEAKAVIKAYADKTQALIDNQAISAAKSLKAYNVPVEFSLARLHPDLYEKTKQHHTTKKQKAK